MDAAPLRRGKATVHTKWNTHVGILSGAGMRIEACKDSEHLLTCSFTCADRSI
ncbi:MAG: polyprenyl synthetase family protein [Crocinitomicaceae bacterium]|nr:polyprenyl synthetase family protein [Crocinitomicaceae bacterium]